MATPKEIEKARADIQRAVDILQACGRYVSPRQLLKIVWNLPLSLHVSVASAVVAALLFVYHVGTFSSPSAGVAQRIEMKSGPLEFKADFPQTDLRPWTMAMTTYLEQTRNIKVVRLTTDPLPGATRRFDLKVETTGEFVAFFPLLLSDNGNVLHPLEPKKVSPMEFTVPIPEGNPGDRIAVFLSARLPQYVDSSGLRKAFFLSVKE